MVEKDNGVQPGAEVEGAQKKAADDKAKGDADLAAEKPKAGMEALANQPKENGSQQEDDAKKLLDGTAVCEFATEVLEINNACLVSDRDAGDKAKAEAAEAARFSTVVPLPPQLRKGLFSPGM